MKKMQLSPFLSIIQCLGTTAKWLFAILLTCCTISINDVFCTSVPLPEPFLDSATVATDSSEFLGFRDFPFVVLPVLFYTPETDIAGGIVGIYSFRIGNTPDSLLRPSALSVVGIITKRKQLIIEAKPRLFWDENRSFLNAEIQYLRFPDYFWGVGANTPSSAEESFSSEMYTLSASYGRAMFAPKLYTGVILEAEKHTTTLFTEGGLLDSRSVRGATGTTAIGTGVFANYDNRDNIFFPTGGMFAYAEAVIFPSWLGSTDVFSRFMADVRMYHAFSQSFVLASQWQTSVTTGETPFQKLPRLGGDKLMRGIYDGRFRDNIATALQAELRLVPLWWRFGLTAFASVGTVAHSVTTLQAEHLRYAFGGGVRFVFNEKERLHIRADLGFSPDGTKLYIQLNEAF